MSRISLPEAYIEYIKKMLGGEAEAFLASYDASRTQGLRLNTAKVSPDSPAFGEMALRFGLEPVPWCPTGCYYREDARPGKHPYHTAGLYYIQEPSAMSAVELLAPEPGDTVLDLAAAPGGKSTQIAGKIGPEGLLVANEIHPARALILSENLERMGLAHAVAVNAAPDRLAECFPGFFDKIMLDAPCSGEGMFRKDPEAIAEWSPGHVAMCAARQLDIVRQAVRMLRPGGRLGYSTCTFNREENEGLVEAVVSEFPDMELERTERIWPHLHRGEGHFVAVLRKSGDGEGVAAASAETRTARKKAPAAAGRGTPPSKPVQEAWKRFAEFAADTFRTELPLPPGEPILFGEQLYWLPHGADGRFSPERLNGLKTPRPGLHLAALKKNRVEPAHALALFAPPGAFRGAADFAADSQELAAYLRGESLPAPAELPSGWVPVCADGYPVGWAKNSAGQLKNHYPKGLRQH